VQTLEFAALSWPANRLGDALTALIRRAHLRSGSSHLADLVAPADSQTDAELKNWVAWAASRLGCEVSAPAMPFRELAQELAAAYPALLRFSEGSYLAIVTGGRGKLSVLTPHGEIRQVSARDLAAALREPAERPLRAELESTLQVIGLRVSPSKQRRTIEALLDEQASGKSFNQCWILRSQFGNGIVRLLRESKAMGNAGGLIVAHTGQYLLWIASWAVLGSLSFAGHMDRGWLLAWALLLATLIPFQLSTTWLQGLFAIGLGGYLKRRLLCGSLRLRPDEMRRGGIGSFLGQALEAESIETLSASGGIAGVLAVIELIMAAFLLGRFALVLLAWCALAVFLGWRFMRRFAGWTAKRMDMTQDLVESMVGYRTRLAQQRSEEWHIGEDLALERYQEVSQRLDGTGLWLMAAIPRGWLVAGVACLAPSIVAGNGVSTQMAILLGGILLAYGAFRKLAGSFADVAAAWVAWKRIKPLLDAASQVEVAGEIATAGTVKAGQKVMEADRLTFRYRSTGSAALRGCSTVIRSGERILLEGPSGGGKSTFASVLCGLRQPESGLLLANGLDLHILGAGKWRQMVAAAPQFHENHILTETLAFNLLMGRHWPPTPTDMKDADEVCRELGLGGLLDRMPSGLLQMIGEGGWQLSHGEKSRVYIARALLQRAALVILDESFAALDPENLKTALECTRRRADTLMVIAHP
jgi:ATP-binding cassette subfamily B protein